MVQLPNVHLADGVVGFLPDQLYEHTLNTQHGTWRHETIEDMRPL